MEAMRSKNLTALQRALDRFNELDMEEKNGEVELAMERMTYLKIGRGSFINVSS